MKYVDMHCDTLMSFATNREFSLEENDKMVDAKKLRNGECVAQLFAMYVPQEEEFLQSGIFCNDCWDYIDTLSNGLFDYINLHKDKFAYAGNYDDYCKNWEEDKISAFLTVEDGYCVNSDLANIKRLYDKGVRLISLTWNYENCFGFPNSSDSAAMSLGLKPFGKEALEYMNELGIIIDVSHLSDGGFYDVADISNVPFVASHSNCREITPHQRNMTDDMIRILADKGGVAGINFCSDFLVPSGGDGESKIEYMIKHIKHFVNKGGIECVGLGSDFDGIHSKLEIKDASMMQNLFERLSFAGFSDSDIEKIAYRNALRVIKSSMK